MRSLVRNKQKIYYALQGTPTEIVDEYGNVTGQYDIHISSPFYIYASVSASQGEIQSRQFGDNEEYDKVIVFDTPNVPIDEFTVFWIDTLPELAEDGSTKTPHDYIVKKIARSLNSTSVAISKVNVNV